MQARDISALLKSLSSLTTCSHSENSLHDRNNTVMSLWAIPDKPWEIHLKVGLIFSHKSSLNQGTALLAGRNQHADSSLESGTMTLTRFQEYLRAFILPVKSSQFPSSIKVNFCITLESTISAQTFRDITGIYISLHQNRYYCHKCHAPLEILKKHPNLSEDQINLKPQEAFARPEDRAPDWHVMTMITWHEFQWKHSQKHSQSPLQFML